MPFLEAFAGGVQLRIHVQPRASRTEVVGLHGDALKIRLAAPPVDGEANDELTRFLARTLGVPRAATTITAGLSSRRKTVRVTGVSTADVRGRLVL